MNGDPPGPPKDGIAGSPGAGGQGQTAAGRGTSEATGQGRVSTRGAGRELWRYVGLGTQLAVTVAVFVGLGWWVDQRYGWSPWGMLVLSCLGLAAAMYHFVKDALR